MATVIDEIRTSVQGTFSCTGCWKECEGESYHITFANLSRIATYCRPCLTQLYDLVRKAFLNGPPAG